MAVDLPDEAVAVVGMAGRFPGAASVDELWQALCAGKVAIRGLSRDELRAAGVPDELADRPDYVAARAGLSDMDQFDADFFGVPRHEASLIDPQHRLFLECAWRAVNDAGHDPRRFDGRIGVYGAASTSSYLLNVVLPSGQLPPDGISYPVLLGNDKDFLCTRVAHRLGLTGPAITVQTACSASLVAVHLAVQALLAGECELALAGGVSVSVPGDTGYLYRDRGILSRDGRCRVFDAAATGTVKGDGCGVVVLRRLAEALADRDQVIAVIRGTAVNNDGADKVGFTAPGVPGQVEVVRAALAVADVPAADIGYVEAHGTGTRLGDPIELRALSRAHQAAGDPPAHCHLGSIKANLGHLDAAAGVTGLIKTALVLRDRTVPVQPDYTEPNPELVPYLDRYQVPSRTVRVEKLRAAAVSSFGLGGTNAHAVLVPAPADPRPPASGSYLIALSAVDTEALRAAAGQLRDRLAAHPQTRIDDVAFTLATGRPGLPARAGFVTDSLPDLVMQLTRYLTGPALPEADAGAATAGTADGGDPARGGALRAWLRDGTLDLATVGDLGAARRVGLPAHPLRPVRCWLDAPAVAGAATSAVAGAATPAVAGAATPAVAGAAAVTRAAGGGGDLAGTVRSVLAGMLKRPTLADDEDFLAIGLDSLAMVELVARLADATGLPLRFEHVGAARTAADLTRALLGLAGAPPHQPATGPTPTAGAATSTTPAPGRYDHLLVKIRQGTGDGHVFLVHPAGGTTVCYVDVGRHITDEHTLWALAFPMSDASRFPTLRDLAALYLDLVRSVQPAGPYLLGGYSFGGNVAVEMALMLEAAGEKVPQVVVVDSHPPEAYLGGTATEADFIAAFPALVASILPGNYTMPQRPPRILAEAIAAVRQPSWPDSMVRELGAFYTVWVHNHQALKRWYPDAKLCADLVVLAATEAEDGTILDQLEIKLVGKQAWTAHLDGALRIVPVGGTHYSIMRDERHLRALAAAYDQVMAIP